MRSWTQTKRCPLVARGQGTVPSPSRAPLGQTFVCDPPQGKDYRGYDWFTDGTWDTRGNTTKSVYLIRDQAVAFLNASTTAKSPFFLYLPFQNIHGDRKRTPSQYRAPPLPHGRPFRALHMPTMRAAPYEWDPKYYDLYPPSQFTDDERILYGYITELDDAIGQVVASLKANQLYDNTIIVFSRYRPLLLGQRRRSARTQCVVCPAQRQRRAAVPRHSHQRLLHYAELALAGAQRPALGGRAQGARLCPLRAAAPERPEQRFSRPLSHHRLASHKYACSGRAKSATGV